MMTSCSRCGEGRKKKEKKEKGKRGNGLAIRAYFLMIG